MGLFLFAGYLVVCCWLAGRLRRRTQCAIKPAHLRIYFIVKVAAALVYGYLAAAAGGSDTWNYHNFGLAETKLLQTDPGRFFSEFFVPGYAHGYGDFFGVTNSWWNDIDAMLITKMLGLMNLASGGRYYINLIFFNLITLAGPVYLYQAARQHLPRIKPWALYIPLLLPSVVYWCSGVHKEGLLLLALGLSVHAVGCMLAQKRLLLKYMLWLLTGLLLLLILRNFLLLPLVAALVAWALAYNRRLPAVASFAAVFTIGVLLFFGLRHLHPKLHLPQVIAQRQADFDQLQGRSKVKMAPLKPTVASFVRQAPAAFSVSLLRPFWSDVYNLRIGLAAAETALINLFLLYALFLFVQQKKYQNPFLLFCLFFSLLLLLIIGYTVPFLGAVVRYRSVAYPFLLLPFACAVFSYREKSRC